MTRLRRRSATVAAVLTALLVMAGCGTISAFVDLQTSLDDAGFSDITVNIDQSANGTGLLIEADPPAGESAEAAQSQAAKIAWTEFPRRFETLRVKIGSDPSRVYDRAELTAQFGERPAGKDDKSLEDDTRQIGIGLLVSLAVGGVLCLGLVVLIIVLVRRSGKKKRAAAQAAWQSQAQGPWGQPGYPPGPGYPSDPGYPPVPGHPQQPGNPQHPGYPPPPPAPPTQNPPGWG